MIHNTRVVRTELKYSNIKPGIGSRQAWEIIEAGLLARRYVIFKYSMTSLSSSALRPDLLAYFVM